MLIFKKKAQAKSRSQTSTTREISRTEAQLVGGGINPQPLPPGRHPVLAS